MGALITFSPFLLGALGADVTLSWGLPERAPYAGETIPVALEVTLPAAWEKGQLLQLYPQPLDLPLQLAGFESLAAGGLVPVEGPQPAADNAGRSVVVDGELDRATGPWLSEGESGRLATYSVRRWFKVPRAGTIELPGAGAHYAVATEFREDFVQGRVPVDRRTEDAVGSAAELEVRALPETGRPFEFAGAIGAFELETAVLEPTIDAGDTVTVDVRVHGTGRSPLPRLEARAITVPATPHFREVGRTITGPDAAGALSVAISLRAEGPSVDALPAPSLTYFDPDAGPEGGYLVATAPSPALRVLPATRATQEMVQTPAESEAAERDERPLPYWTIGVLTLIFLFAVASVIRRQLARSQARAEAHARAQAQAQAQAQSTSRDA